MDVTIALTKEEVATLRRAVKYAIGNTLRVQANVRRRLAAAVNYGRKPDPVEVENEAFLTDELATMRGFQDRLRALDVDGCEKKAPRRCCSTDGAGEKRVHIRIPRCHYKAI